MNDFLGFLNRVDLQEDAVESVINYRMGEEEYRFYRKLFDENIDSFYYMVLQSGQRWRLFLYLYSRFAFELGERYRQLGIEESIYFDTFSDLGLWSSICKRDYNTIGLAEYDWLWRHCKFQLFRLGRLQFEWYPAAEEIQTKYCHIKPGEIQLNVHIPEGTPLTEESCEESFEKADVFFKTSIPFVCCSWFLYPGLSEVLPESSNLMKFRNRFVIYKIDNTSRDAEERIFIRKQDNPADYPEDTSLQRAVKQALLAGKSFGNGYGVYMRNKGKEQTLIN